MPAPIDGPKLLIACLMQSIPAAFDFEQEEQLNSYIRQGIDESSSPDWDRSYFRENSSIRYAYASAWTFAALYPMNVGLLQPTVSYREISDSVETVVRNLQTLTDGYGQHIREGALEDLEKPRIQVTQDAFTKLSKDPNFTINCQFFPICVPPSEKEKEEKEEA